MAPLDKSFSEPIREEGPTGKTPYSRNFLSEILRGPEKINSAKPASEKKSVFSGRGIKPKALEKQIVKTDISTHLKKDQLKEISSEIKKPGYQPEIRDLDVKRHLKVLKEQMREGEKKLANVKSLNERNEMMKEQYILKEKMRLLEKMKDPE